MASWKLCGLLLLCVLVALVAEAESRRGRGNGRGGSSRRGGREENEAANPEDEGGEEDLVGAEGDDGEEGLDAGETGPGHHAGGRRGGRGRGRGGGQRRPGRGGPGRGGPGRGGRGHGGRRGGRGRQLPPEKLAMLMSGLSRSTGEFGLGLYREVAKTNPNNFVVSPISVHSAMSQLLLAAAGNTKRQLITGLNIRSPVHPAVKAYAESLNEEEEEEEEEEQAVLAIANKMYVQAGFQFNPKFNQRLQQFYNSSLEEFAAENPEDAVNQWVEEQTNGEIVDFLNEGDITPETLIMLINAVYFKGNWADQFDAARTSLKPFQVNDADTVQVDTMQREGSYGYQQSSTLGASIIELPYEGDRYSFFIILPDADTSLSDVESRLSADLLNETLSAEIHEHTINLEVPKFSLDTEEALKESLQALGIRDAFDRQKAKLKKLTRARNTFVNEVQHRAVIEVDEQGTVAAAATGLEIRLTSLPMPVKVDRPFMFIIRDKEYDLNLFMGRYTDPNGENLGM